VSLQEDDYGRLQERLYWNGPHGPNGRVYIWGGYLTENVVQAISRDILAEAVVRCEDAGRDIGLRIGHHIHDEVIGLVLAEYGPQALEIEIAALRHRPEWAPDCPLDAEGHINRRYSK